MTARDDITIEDDGGLFSVEDRQSAPRDGTRLLAVGSDFEGVRVVGYGKTSHLPWEGFCLADQGAEEFDLCSPTAWQPLPSPPTGNGA